jgi:hypothetical protein
MGQKYGPVPDELGGLRRGDRVEVLPHPRLGQTTRSNLATVRGFASYNSTCAIVQVDGCKGPSAWLPLDRLRKIAKV